MDMIALSCKKFWFKNLVESKSKISKYIPSCSKLVEDKRPPHHKGLVLEFASVDQQPGKHQQPRRKQKVEKSQKKRHRREKQEGDTVEKTKKKKNGTKVK